MPRYRRALSLLVVCIVSPCLASGFAAAADNFGWRGDGTGRFPESNPPQVWSPEENVVWRTKLPAAGNASPVVIGDRLLVTAEPAKVVCLSAADGEILWQADADYETILGPEKGAEIEATYKSFDMERQTLKELREQLRDKDPNDPQLAEVEKQMGQVEERKKEFARKFPSQRGGGSRNASATPISDGKNIFALFNTGILIALDGEGNRRWFKKVETSNIGFGHSSSPTLAAGNVVVHLGEMIAFDAQTGEPAWSAALSPRHGSPIVAKVGNDEAIITPGGAVVRGSDGKVLAEKLFSLSENSPLVHNGIIYAHEAGSIKAFALPASLEQPLETTPIWESDSTREQRMTSALYHQGLLYAASRSGIMDVTDAETGDVLYRKRLNIGQVFSSATLAGDLIYIGSKEGKMVVLRPGRKFEEVALNEVEGFSSTPVFVGQRMYLRTNNELYCIGK